MENLFVCAVVALSFGAASQPEPAPPITEADVLAAIDAEHAALWESVEETEAARARALAARSLDDPALGVEREAPDGLPEQWTWSLRWRPPLDGRRALGIQAADASREAAGLRADRALLELRLQARVRFAEWSIAEARARVLEQAAATIDPLLRRAEARAEIGEASRLEARRLSLALSALAAERTTALVAARSARAAVEAILPGLPPDAVPELPTLPEPFPGDPADSLLPVLRSELDATALEARLAARIFRFPEITLGWQRLEDGPLTSDGPVAGIELALPLFDRNRSQRIEVAGRQRALEARIALREREVASTWQAALEIFELLQAQSSAAAEAAAEAVVVVTGAAAAFRLGETDVADLLDALRAAREAELIALDLRAAALEALRRLDALGGDASLDPPAPAPTNQPAAAGANRDPEN
jgi:outer membrane protein TolC